MKSRFPRRPPPNTKSLMGVKMRKVGGHYAHDPYGQLYVLNPQSGWVPVRGDSKAYRAYVDMRKREVRRRLGRKPDAELGEFDRWNDEERALRKRHGKAKYRRRRKSTKTRRRR